MRAKPLPAFRFASLALSFGLSLGCQRGPEVRFSTPQQIFDRIYERTACSRAVVGDARIEVAGPFAHYEGKLMFRAAVPDRLRFDLYSDFGVSLAAMASDAEAFSFFDLRSNTFLTGEPGTCSLARFTQVRISPFALVELLRGRPPVLEHEEQAAELSFENPLFSEGHYEVHVRGENDLEQTLWISVPEQDWASPLQQQRVFLRRVRVEQAGKVHYSVRLGDYRKVSPASLEPTVEEREMGIFALAPTGPECQAALPHFLSFDVGRGGHALNIVAMDLAHNPPRSSGAFQVVAPRGAIIEQNACP